MVEEAVAMVEVVVGMVEASAVEAAILLVAVVISLGLLAVASQNTKERTLRGTKIISGTTVISFLEVPLGTEIPIRMIISTTAIITTMTATIMMGSTHQTRRRFLRRPLLPCRRS